MTGHDRQSRLRPVLDRRAEWVEASISVSPCVARHRADLGYSPHRGGCPPVRAFAIVVSGRSLTATLRLSRCSLGDRREHRRSSLVWAVVPDRLVRRPRSCGGRSGSDAMPSCIDADHSSSTTTGLYDRRRGFDDRVIELVPVFRTSSRDEARRSVAATRALGVGTIVAAEACDGSRGRDGGHRKTAHAPCASLASTSTGRARDDFGRLLCVRVGHRGGCRVRAERAASSRGRQAAERRHGDRPDRHGLSSVDHRWHRRVCSTGPLRQRCQVFQFDAWNRASCARAGERRRRRLSMLDRRRRRRLVSATEPLRAERRT